jgi:hypothetical protein
MNIPSVSELRKCRRLYAGAMALASRALLGAAAAVLLHAAPAAAQDPPCGPGSPPAAELVAPERLAFGRDGSAGIADVPGRTPVQRASIQVGDAGPVAVRGPGAATDRVRFRLRLDDQPLRVRLTTTEAAEGSAAPCGRTFERRVRGFRRIRVASGCNEGSGRPRRMTLCTVDWGWSASKLRWRRWNRDIARGHGRWSPACVPTPGLPPRCGHPRAAFELTRIRWCPSHSAYFYTRMRVRPRVGKPETVELGCPAPRGDAEG